MTGLNVSIYRDGSDCTNNGVTSPERCDGRAVVFDDVPDGNVTLGTPRLVRGKQTPRLVIERRKLFGDKPDHIRAVPCDKHGKSLPGWWMFGGNFIWTSDSRFRQSISEYPVPVHDRQE